MRVRPSILVSLALLLTAVTAHADGKPNFGATGPGSWARSESTWEMPGGMAGTNVVTYLRASDDAGRTRVELLLETTEGPGAGMTSRQLYVFTPEFAIASQWLDHMHYLQANISQTDDGQPVEMPAETVAIIRESAGEMTDSLTLVGRETVDGRSCDHYRYSYSMTGPQTTTLEGEVWIDESLPFGVVRKTGRTLDQSGTVISSFEERLLDFGEEKEASSVLLTRTPFASEAAPPTGPAEPRRLGLVDAYDEGHVRLLVQASRQGRQLRIILENNGETPLTVAVPSGSLKLKGSSPVSELSFRVESAAELPLPPGGETRPLVVEQLGKHGVREGEFELVVYEGEPLFQGSVEIGPLD